MKETLSFANFEVKVIRSARRKTAAIKVDLDGVSVRVPQDLPAERIQKLIAGKVDWVEKKLDVAEQKRRGIEAQAMQSATLGAGSPILLQGSRRRLELQSASEVSIAETSAQLRVQGPGDLIRDPDQLRALIEQWLYARAVEELQLSINVYKQKVGVSPSQIQIKDYRARWGSCKPDGSIQLNWRLIHAPIYVMDYVVIHELCHLLEMNHSQRFWSAVERIDPQYRMKREWLKDNGWRLTM